MALIQAKKGKTKAWIPLTPEEREKRKQKAIIEREDRKLKRRRKYFFLDKHTTR